MPAPTSNQVSTARLPRTDMRPIMVTTEHRGVFFGYVPFDSATDGKTLVLTDARNVLFWSRDVRGFMGLASQGPDAACRVGPFATIEVRNITSVVSVTTGAAARWELGPWGV